MTALHATEGAAEMPLVAVVYTVPLVTEAVLDALAGIAQLRPLPACGTATAALLRSLRPDAVVVDSDAVAEAAAVFARESGTPLLQLSPRDGGLRVLTGEAWEAVPAGASPDAIRNVLVATLFAPRRAR